MILMINVTKKEPRRERETGQALNSPNMAELDRKQTAGGYDKNLSKTKVRNVNVMLKTINGKAVHTS